MTETTSNKALFKWILATSLGLNLLIAGLLIGAMLRSGGPPRAFSSPNMSNLVQALPQNTRDTLRTRLSDGMDSRAERIRISRQQHADLRTALLAEPIDRSAAQALFMQQINANIQNQTALLDAVLDELETFSVAQREDFLDSLRTASSRRSPQQRDTR